MHRSSIDKLVSWTGITIAAVLLVASIGLYWAHNYIHDQVREQLVSQKVTFPAAGSEALNALPQNDREQVAVYAGQELTTGAQAKVFANNYINVHLSNIAGGQTYSELSAASMANPDDTALAGKVATVFRGETLRGLLLNAYAFDTVATIALYGAYGTSIACFILLVFAYLGLNHAKKVSPSSKSRTKTSKK